MNACENDSFQKRESLWLICHTKCPRMFCLLTVKLTISLFNVTVLCVTWLISRESWLAYLWSVHTVNAGKLIIVHLISSVCYVIPALLASSVMWGQTLAYFSFCGARSPHRLCRLAIFCCCKSPSCTVCLHYWDFYDCSAPMLFVGHNGVIASRQKSSRILAS